jgi:hypothetical protein
MKNEIADPEQSDNNAYQIISACAIPSTVLAAERVIPSIIKIPIVSRRDQSDIIQVFTASIIYFTASFTMRESWSTSVKIDSLHLLNLTSVSCTAQSPRFETDAAVSLSSVRAIVQTTRQRHPCISFRIYQTQQKDISR